MRGFGINGAEYATGNPDAVEGRKLPWLQDQARRSVWTSWGAEWRDVVILDTQNRRVAVYPVLAKTLDDPANRAELKQLLLNVLAR